jgi:thymidylate kinase
MPIAIGLSRTSDAEGDKHERNGAEFFEKARTGYLICIKDSRFAKKAVIIDATGTIEEVSQRVIQMLEISNTEK